MSLKIIGGVYGGRVLRSVRGVGTRPLLGQVREALFNILADRVPSAIVWDLFAGSGASGIEAMSHGAERVLFCEKNGRAVDVLKQNLQMLGGDAVARAVVLRADAWDPPVMHRAAFGAGRPDGESTESVRDDASDAEIAPDIVFLDPPYAMVAEDPVKSMARARRLLDRTAPGGCVVFHFEAGLLDEDDFDDDLDLDLREWGSTAIAMLWRKGEAPERLQRRWEKERARAE
jgi:16S rRNA (guanine966-N2)-methyltransferase